MFAYNWTLVLVRVLYRFFWIHSQLLDSLYSTGSTLVTFTIVSTFERLSCLPRASKNVDQPLKTQINQPNAREYHGLAINVE